VRGVTRNHPDDVRLAELVVSVLVSIFKKCRGGSGYASTRCHIPFEAIVRTTRRGRREVRKAIKLAMNGKGYVIIMRSLGISVDIKAGKPLIYEKNHGNGSKSYGLTKYGAKLVDHLLTEISVGTAEKKNRILARI